MTESFKNNYPSNAHKAKPKSDIPEKKKVEKVENVEAVHRKKSLGKKISETFTGDDMQSVGDYVLFDVIIPAAKSMIADAASQGVERMLFGEVRRPRTGANRAGSTYVSYNRVGSSSPGRAFEPDGPTRNLSRRARATHDFGEIIIQDRGKAEIVLERMGDLLDMYGVVSVTDFYDLVDITGSYTDDKWGWTDLRGARVLRDRAGYLIDLPNPQPLD